MGRVVACPIAPLKLNARSNYFTSRDGRECLHAGGPDRVRPSLRLPEQDDAVRVGSLAVVVDTPAGRGLRELLRIDQHEDGVQARMNPAWYDVLFQSNAPATHLTHLKCDVAAGFQHASQFHKYLR